jgi:diaminohydroxyphosphoribosylaminopyrimidine deaminase/5-amino-6-(5-phosphoribosylamino)uracil reductase
MKFTAQDERFMQRALSLARRGLGKTSPNPVVGAVLVRNGRIIGKGYHKRAGGPHAEVFALRGVNARGATLYVTMEPCCTWGKTPPCTDAIIAAGVKRVVVAALDPNPKHDGHGLKVLRRAGIRVDAGLLADDATRMNESFNKWITTGLPFVIAKAAMSLDGKIATRTGDSKWITSETARKEAHKLRARVDAIMVGANTVIRDDPQLTMRHGIRGRQPWRVVVDARGRCPRSASLFTDKLRRRTIVLTTTRSPARWRRYLALLGIAVVTGRAKNGWVDLNGVLRALGKMNVTSVLVEGGGELLGSLFDQRLIDKVSLFYAPLVIGGRKAVTAAEGEGAARVNQAVHLRDCRWQRIGQAGEMLLEAAVAR